MTFTTPQNKTQANVAMKKHRDKHIAKANQLLRLCGPVHNKLVEAFLASTEDDFPALTKFLLAARSCVNLLHNLSELDYENQSPNWVDSVLNGADEFLAWFELMIKGTEEIFAKEKEASPQKDEAIHVFMEASNNVH